MLALIPAMTPKMQATAQAATVMITPMPMHAGAQPITPTIDQRIWKFSAFTASAD